MYQPGVETLKKKANLDPITKQVVNGQVIHILLDPKQKKNLKVKKLKQKKVFHLLILKQEKRFILEQKNGMLILM